jgi:hypothetical protein
MGNKRFIITEDEKSRILNLHKTVKQNLIEQRIADLPKSSQTGPTPRNTPNFSQTKPANTTQTKTTSQQKKCYFNDVVSSQAFAIWFLKYYKDYATKIGLTQKTDKCSDIMGKAYNYVIAENSFNVGTAGEYYVKMMTKPKSNLGKVDQSAYAANVDSTAVSVGYDPKTGKKITTQKTYVDPSKLTGPQPGMSADDIVDIISGVIELVPAIGTAVSAGIDIVHTLSYVYRASTENNPEDKALYTIQGIAGFGTSIAPEIGNVFNISLRGFLKKLFGWWGELINAVTKMVSENKVSQSFLTWLKAGGFYQKVLFALQYLMKKLGIDALTDKIKTEVSNQLQKVKNAIKDTKGLGWLVNIINAFLRYLGPAPELKQGIDAVLNDIGVIGTLRGFING